MKITQIEKTMDNVLMDCRNNMYFLKRAPITYRGQVKEGNYNLFSTRVGSVALDELDEYLADPDIVLVKIEDV